MKVLQWNMTSYTTQFDELKILIEDHVPDCICLQETRHANKTIPYCPSGYKFLQPPISRRPDSDDEDAAYRGVALLYNKNVNIKKLDLNLPNNIEAVAAQIYVDKYYTVCSMYLSPNKTVRKSEIIQIIDQLPQPFLLLGDMNARHTRWGDENNRTNNPKGEIFEELLIEQDMELLNETENTHYSIQHGTKSLIDLSIASSDCFPDFECTVLKELHNSDHYPIIVKKQPTPEIGEPSLRFQTEKADWTKFKNLTIHYSRPEGEQDIDEEVEYMTNFIIDAASESIPVSRKRRKEKIPVPWFNAQCREAKIKRRRAERALQRNHNVQNLLAYRRLCAECRKTYNEAKKKSWADYVSSINANTTPKEMWQKIHKISGKYKTHPLPLLKTSTGEETKDTNVTSKIFAEAFSNVSNDSNYEEQFVTYKNRKEREPVCFNSGDQSGPYNEDFSINELLAALRSTSESSPGEDRIVYSMIKNAHSSFQEHILNLYNRIYANRQFPTSWKTAIIIPIPKPNKDHSDPLNHRPISLTSCLCKLFEKMVNQRLVWYLEKNQCIQPVQSGFRRNRSTTDCLVSFTHDVQQAIIYGNHTLVVFFDLTKAYDMAWKHGILVKLHHFGLRGNLPIFISNFLQDRKLKVKVGNSISAPEHIPQGVPQGSVLSCTLFAIAIDCITEQIPSTVKSCLYVDDFTIYCSSKDLERAKRRMQMAINNLQDWCLKTGFKFSIDKTVSMHICRHWAGGRYCKKESPKLMLNGTEIKKEESHKFLGLIIDQSLKWDKHIKYLREECHKRLAIMKHLSFTKYGADCKTLLRIYNALIKSKLDYGVEAYGSACKTALKKLNPIQNTALRIATGAFRTSSAQNMQVLSGVKHLPDARKEKLVKYLIRVLVNPSNPVNPLIEEEVLPLRAVIDENMDPAPDAPKSITTKKMSKLSFMYLSACVLKEYQIDEHALMRERTPEIPLWLTCNLSACGDIIQNAKTTIPERILKIIYQNHINTHTNESQVYTDGSKTNDGTAFAVVRQHPPFSYVRKMESWNSVYSAELTAIHAAVRTSSTVDKERVTIFTDSKSSIQAIQSPIYRNQLVSDIHQSLQESTKQYRLCWVPSHVGISGNEQADRLAKEATKSELCMASPMLRSDAMSKVKMKTKQIWQQRWVNSSGKLREITSDLSPLPDSHCSSRYWERTLARLRLGHTRLTHGHLMDRREAPTCEECTEMELLTVKHILVECVGYRDARMRCYGRNIISMKYMLKEGDTSPSGPLAQFITSIGLLSQI